MLLFAFALLVLLISSLPWVAVARPQNKPAWLMALYLIGCANITLTSYIANSFYLLNQRTIILLIHACIGGIGWLIWMRSEKPSIWGPFQNWKTTFNLRWIKHKPALAFLSLGIFASYLFALIQITLIPQNNVDSLSTHLARIVFWRQHGSFFPWHTFMPNQVWYPVNAQLQTYWTLLFLGNDKLVGAVQWLSALVTGLSVFGISRLLGYRRNPSAFAALIFLSFPLIALQATTTQTDLVTAVFFTLAVYFLILGLKVEKLSFLFLSAISVGIGIGVKKSYFLLLPVLGLAALLLVFHFGRHKWKQIAIWGLSLIIGALFFGSYMYIFNWQHWGSPFGSPKYLDNLLTTPQSTKETPVVMAGKAGSLSVVARQQNDANSNKNILLEVTYNIPRLLYQALDTSGLPRPLDGYAHKVKMRIIAPFFQWIGFEEIEGKAFAAPGHVFNFADKNVNEESHAWYGPLSALLLLPALVLKSWQGIRERSFLLLIPGAALLIFLPMEIILRPGWDPFQGRYFAPLIALGAPLMATWFKEDRTPVHEWLIGVLAITIISVTLLYNPAKPTLGKYADDFQVWTNDRIFVQTIQRKNNRYVYYMVEQETPANASLGYHTPSFFLEYPLFGANVSRRLTPILLPSQISDAEWLNAQGIDYILLPNDDQLPTPPETYQLISQLPYWNLYARASAP